MRQVESDKRKYLIIGLCAVLVVMVVGFAAFSSQLTINGTSNITSTWNVEITGITKFASSSGVTDGLGSPSYDNTHGLTASFSINLVSPGDYATYKIKVENLGSLNAVLSNINLESDSSNDITYYVNKDHTNTDITDTDRVLKQNDVLNSAGDSSNLDEGYVYVTVKYNSYEGQTSPTGDSKSVSATVKLDFVQTGSEVVPPPTPRTASEVVEMIGVTPVTSGDGLYNNGDGSYTYKGANPANYLSFAGSTWRILGIDSTGIKIIRDEKLDIDMPFDTANARATENNSYCTSSYGCNIWSKDYSPSSSFNNRGLVNQDSTLKTYLNGDYLTNTLSNNSNIIDGTYNVGPKNNESSYTWTGKIALLTAPEYNAAGGSSSYLRKSYNWWLLSPNESSTTYVYTVNSGGNVNYNNASASSGVRPVLYLSSNITITGTGTDSNNAFTIS